MTEIEKDVADLKELLGEAVKILLDSRMEMFALQGVLIEHHGLQVEVLEQYRDLARRRAEKFREALEPATPETLLEQLKRFQGPPQ